jgi:hypothetical protein
VRMGDLSLVTNQLPFVICGREQMPPSTTDK